MATNGTVSSNSIRFADEFELDLGAYELRRAGQPLKLGRIPMELLLLLVEQRGQLVTREQIVDKIWGKGVFLDTDNSINAAIRKIRQTLDDDPDDPRFVQTVIGRGYRFIAPVDEAGLPPAHILTAQQAQESRVGKRIGHYRILQMLDGGEMGLIFMAEDLILGRRVALKFLPIELAGDRAAFERLQREARAASALDHPNICAIYQFGEDQGQPFIVMQLLEGETLREWIERSSTLSRQVRNARVLDLATQIVDGLEFAHENGIIHRDIIPANIFITSRGRAKILDFGLAKCLEETQAGIRPHDRSSAEHSTRASMAAAGASLTQIGTACGTPSYLSPEQVRRESVDQRSDLFSLGLVLYEMATRQRAFSGDTAGEIHDAVLHRNPRPARQLNPDLSHELENIISKCIEKDPAKRYQSAAELRLDLAGIKRDKKQARSQKINLALAAGAITLVVVVVLASMKLGGARTSLFQRTSPSEPATSSRTRPSLAVLGFKNLSGNDEAAWVSTALSELLSTDLAAGQQLRITPGEDVARMKADLSLPADDMYSSDTLTKIRGHLGSDMIVLGSYLAVGKGGGKIRINLKVQDARTGEIIGAISEDGDEANLASLISQSGDSLRKILRVDGITANEALHARAALPANSEATRLYAEAVERMRRFDDLAARNLLLQAIAADPNHAQSHAALSECWSNLGYDLKAQAEAKKAFDLSAKLSRDEQLSIEGRYRVATREWPRAIDIYRMLWEFFPDNPDYGLELANVQISARLGKDTMATAKKLSKLSPTAADDPRIDLVAAKAAENIGDFKRMQQLAAAAAQKGRAQSESLVVAEAKLIEGTAYDRLGDFPRAIASLKEADEAFTRAGDQQGAARSVLEVGNVLYDQGDFNGARARFEESLAIFSRTGSKGSMARALRYIGNVLYDQGKLTEAEAKYQQVLAIDRETGYKASIAGDLGNMANVLDSLGRLNQARDLQNQALDAYLDAGDKNGAAITLNNLGNLLDEIGDLPGALQSFEHAAGIDSETGHKRGYGFALTGWGLVLLEQDRLPEARSKLEQAMSLRKELGEKSTYAMSQLYLAQVFFEENRVDQTGKLARDAAAQFVIDKSAENETTACATLVRVLLAQQKIREARSAADQAIALSRNTGYFSARFDASIASATVDGASGNVAKARRELDDVIGESTRLGFLGYQLRARLERGLLEMRSGKQDAARAYLVSVRNDAAAKGYRLIARRATI